MGVPKQDRKRAKAFMKQFEEDELKRMQEKRDAAWALAQHERETSFKATP